VALQVNVVEQYSTGELLLQTAQAALTVIKEYQVRSHGWPCLQTSKAVS
jgi:hypothetical protein